MKNPTSVPHNSCLQGHGIKTRVGKKTVTGGAD